MHNKVVYRAARALTQSGFATLRFQFRGVGLSKGRYDAGRGEVDDVRAALDEAEARAGLPLLAGGFSFGAAMALKASDRDPRVAAFVGLGLPVASESGRMLPRPSVPALFVVGGRDTYGPPDELTRFLQGAPSARVVVIPDADHFFEGRLEELGETVREFLDGLALPAAAGAASGRAS
jgi:alpha/beta superfamily hydrolase